MPELSISSTRKKKKRMLGRRLNKMLFETRFSPSKRMIAITALYSNIKYIGGRLS
jgi:hypothetical protein